MAQKISNLAVGSKIKFGKYSVNGETAESITWLIAAKGHSASGYPNNSITLLTEKVVDIRAIDGAEAANSNEVRALEGNNNYTVSNLDQWMNKDTGWRAHTFDPSPWFVKQHSADGEPHDGSVNGGAGYAGNAGFLNAFDDLEKAAILNTTIRCRKPNIDGGGYADVARKVYLLSLAEIGLKSPVAETDASEFAQEGTILEYFTTNSRMAYITKQAHDYSTVTNVPDLTSGCRWWLRSSNYLSVSSLHLVRGNGLECSVSSANYGYIGVRPALNLSATMSVSDTTDADGCYTIVWNSEPSRPVDLNIPTTIYGGKSHTVSWSAANDPDGDTVYYELECAYDGGSFTSIYRGTNLSYTNSVPFGKTSVIYRVRSSDNLSFSEYTTAVSTKIINNSPPQVDGIMGDLGVVNEGSVASYGLTDTDDTTMTVIESVDGVQLRSIVRVGGIYPFLIEGNDWLKLTNGTHYLTVTAIDSIGNTTTKSASFVKSVSSCSVVTATMASSAMPTRISLDVSREVPAASTFKVEVCNNGYDSTPTWEDATEAVVSNLVYGFTNTSKTASNWGVKVRVTLNRNGGTGACYISAIGGNFE